MTIHIKFCSFGFRAGILCAALLGWAGNIFAKDAAPQAVPATKVTLAALKSAGKIDAASLRVVLRANAGELELIVEDDGKGFDAEQLRSAQARARHFGFVSMAERAELVGGRVEIRPREPQGTVVHAVFPLRQEAGAPFPLVAL